MPLGTRRSCNLPGFELDLTGAMGIEETADTMEMCQQHPRTSACLLYTV